MAGIRTTEKIVGEVTTSDATETTVVSYSIPQDNIAFNAEVTVVGRDVVTNDAVMSQKAVAGKRSSGTASLVGAIVNVAGNITNALLSTTAVRISTSSASIQVKVTGKSSTTIDWHAELKVVMN